MDAPLTGRRKGVLISAALAARSIIELPFAELRQGSSSYMLWMNRCGAWEAKGKVEKFENHEFMRLVVDGNGITRGIVMMDLFNLKLSVLKADAVVVATGGSGVLL